MLYQSIIIYIYKHITLPLMSLSSAYITYVSIFLIDGFSHFLISA